jgi:hypothetical protein
LKYYTHHCSGRSSAWIAVLAMFLLAGLISPPSHSETQAPPALMRVVANPLIGGWKADTYFLKDGSNYPLVGQILFTEKTWSVLFIVMKDGKSQRGSGEGGEYTVEGNHVTFIHHFMISTAAPEIPGLKEQPMRALEWDKANVEVSTFEVAGDRMTLFMPSGNRLTWTRSSN